jgi:hypothetical protein
MVEEALMVAEAEHPRVAPVAVMVGALPVWVTVVEAVALQPVVGLVAVTV